MPVVDPDDVGELLRALELVGITRYGEHALSSNWVMLTGEAGCDPSHPYCLAVHCRVAGRYLRLHLTRADARKLSHLLYYRSIDDPMDGIAER